MVKGTPSMGLKHKITHIRCRSMQLSTKDVGMYLIV